jgi:hypothetical protein
MTLVTEGLAFAGDHGGHGVAAGRVQRYRAADAEHLVVGVRG